MDTSTQLHRKNCTVVQSWFAQEVQLEADSLEVPTAAVALAEEPKAEQAAEEEATATEVANSIAAAAVLARAEVAEAAHSVAPETLEKDSAARKLALAVAASAEEVDLARAVEWRRTCARRPSRREGQRGTATCKLATRREVFPRTLRASRRSSRHA